MNRGITLNTTKFSVMDASKAFKKSRTTIYEASYIVVLNLAISQVNEHTDIKVKLEQHKRGRNIFGFSFSFKQKKNTPINSPKNTEDLFSKLTDAQRHLFAKKLSDLPEMSKYSHGTESYQQFAIRIAEMLQDQEKFEELLPYLKKIGYKAK